MTLSREVIAKNSIDKHSSIEYTSILKLNTQLKTKILLKTGDFGHYGTPALPLIDWIGDLDHNGKMDILLSIVTECGYDYRLFLSSLANLKKRELIHSAENTLGELVRCGC